MGAVVSGVGSLITGKSPGQNNNTNQQAALVKSPASQAQADKAYGLTNDAIARQAGFADMLAAQNGVGTQSNVLNQQQQLANTLLAQSQGQGPNPAQEQFKQNLDAATKNAAGTISSMKGISPALAAELIARGQSSANQDASGKAAELQANQILAAQNNLMNQQNNIQNVAGNQVANEAAANSNLLSGTQNNQNSVYNAITNTNNTNSNAQVAAQNNNAAASQSNANNQGQFIGGITNAIAGAAAKKAGYGAEGGKVADMPKADDHFSSISSMYYGAPMMAAGGEVEVESITYTPKKDGPMVPGTPKVDHNSYANDVVPALLTPEEVVLPLSVMKSEDPAKAASAFVKELLKKDSKGDDKEQFHIALKAAISKRGKK